MAEKRTLSVAGIGQQHSNKQFLLFPLKQNFIQRSDKPAEQLFF
jgi:hypothetical protein